MWCFIGYGPGSKAAKYGKLKHTIFTYMFIESGSWSFINMQYIQIVKNVGKYFMNIMMKQFNNNLCIFSNTYLCLMHIKICIKCKYKMLALEWYNINRF